MKQKIIYRDLGRVDFDKAWEYQEQLLQEIISIKKQPGREKAITPHYFLLCEHPHVFTLGKSGKPEHLLANEKTLDEINAKHFRINRGGDITYHGPGQLVGYPILNLDLFFNDIHRYMRCLEEVIIRTLAEYNLKGERIENVTGVWMDAQKPAARKICAFGVRCSRWVTMHGFAFNINTDLEYFNHIVPCGIRDKSVTSLMNELGYEVELSGVKQKIRKHFSDVFQAEMIEQNIFEGV